MLLRRACLPSFALASTRWSVHRIDYLLTDKS